MADDEPVANRADRADRADRLPLVEAELEAALAHARAELAVVRGSLATVVTYLSRPS